MTHRFSPARLLGANPIVLATILIFLIFSAVAPGFTDAGNVSNILRQSSMLGLVAIGMSFVILTGGIDLSVGSVVALSTVLVTGLASNFPPILGLNVALIAGCAVGIANGVLVAYLGLQPIIATVASMAMVRGLGMWLSDSRPIFGTLPEQFFLLSDATIYLVPVPALLFLVAAVLSGFYLHYTNLGRSIYQVGGNEEAAALAGVNVARVKVTTYAISGVLSAAAGLLLTARMQSGDAVRTGMGWELDAIAAAAVGGLSLSGGRGNIVGTVCGVLIIGMMSNAFNLLGINPYWQRMVVGAVLALAVLAYGEPIRRLLSTANWGPKGARTPVSEAVGDTFRRP